MGLLDTLKKGARGFVSAVKNLVTGGSSSTGNNTYEEAQTETQIEEASKPTLNEQITSGAINNNTNTTTNTNGVTQFKSAIDAVKESIGKTSNALEDIDTRVNPIQQNTPEAVKAKEVTVADIFKGNTEAWEKLGDSIVSAPSNVFGWAGRQIDKLADFTKSAVNGRRATTEYNRNEQLVAVGYDPNSKNVKYLDLNESRGAFDNDLGTRSGVRSTYEKYLSEWASKVQDPNATQEEKYQAYADFYDKAKYLFRIREDDYYTNGLFGEGDFVKRRYNMYTQEELDQLAKTGKGEGKYEPTEEEFWDFVEADLENQGKKQDINEKYGVSAPDDEDEPELVNLSEDAHSNFKSEMLGIATQNFDDYFWAMREVNGGARTDVETYAYNFFNGQIDRLWNEAAPVWNAEKEILKRDKSTWTGWDEEVLKVAEQLREASKGYAEGMNEWVRQQALYGTSKEGHMVRMLDVFENGESLGDVLNKRAIEAIPTDFRGKAWRDSYSILDIMGQVANDVMWGYSKEHNTGFWSPVKNLWSDVEYYFRPTGVTLGEFGQGLAQGSLEALNYVVTGHDSKFADYIDQDFTRGYLIETDDGNFTRLVKKYGIEAAEYAPEAIGNLIPDVALEFMTGGATTFTLLRHLKDTKKVLKLSKAAKGQSLARKVWSVITKNPDDAARYLGVTGKKYQEIMGIVKNSPKISQKVKTFAELLDNAVTELSLGQFMDAQWSAYDTEPYSNASFFMSIIGSGMFDLFSPTFRGLTGRGWFNTLIGDGKGGNIWTLARYMDSSEEAANNVARALGKSVGDVGLDDLKAYARSFTTIEEAAKTVYNQLNDAEKAAIGDLTKKLTWNLVSQAYGSNSNIAKRIRLILSNGSTNIADVYKYLGMIPGDVSIGPYVSTIKLKNGTDVYALGTGEKGMYKPELDAAFSGNFTTKLREGFSEADLKKLGKVKDMEDVVENKEKYFYKTGDEKTGYTYHVNEEGLSKFGLKAENLSLDAVGISIARAEEVKEVFKEKMKNLANNNLKPETIDMVANSGGYDETVSMVKEVLGC